MIKPSELPGQYLKGWEFHFPRELEAEAYLDVTGITDELPGGFWQAINDRVRTLERSSGLIDVQALDNERYLRVLFNPEVISAESVHQWVEAALSRL